MYAAIIELDALTDPVGAAAEHHHLLARAAWDSIRRVIGRVIICRVLDSANRHFVPRLDHTNAGSLLADFFFGCV